MHLDAGLLALDEICSPVQLILDDELVSALNHWCKEYSVGEEELALDLIEELWPGGNYLPTEHTAAHYRHELWEPRVWSREMTGAWIEGGRLLDADRAAAWYRDTQRERRVEPLLNDGEEQEIQAIIHRAAKALRL